MASLVPMPRGARYGAGLRQVPAGVACCSGMAQAAMTMAAFVPSQTLRRLPA